MPIRVAVIGVGNCCSSLYQGIHYYALPKNEASCNEGLMRPEIGGYTFRDIEFVAAFDVDRRKVGLVLRDALLQKPNCTPLFVQPDEMTEGPVVLKSPVLDGVGHIMEEYPEDQAFRVDDTQPELSSEDIESILRDRQVDIVINYLPVGSQKATEFWAERCLATGVSLCNCIPVFIASNPIWEQRFVDAGIPLIGDDMKSQFGASILSQMLQELAFARGHEVKFHCQRNVGGNTDFLNMVDQTRLKSKKISKENVIKAQNRIRNISMENSFLHAGPSEYIQYYGDNKVANFRLELKGFMGSPVIFDAQLSVIDSPNSAGVVIDAIRYLKVARELGVRGSLRGPSAFTQKTPPEQQMFNDTMLECNALANRHLTEKTVFQTKPYVVSDLIAVRGSHNTNAAI